MAIKKSELYSMLWKSCDELRGGMDASQYKDYVLVILFVKYISDKAKADPDFILEIPDGCSFDDFIELKGKSAISINGEQKNIGEAINIKLAALANANGLDGVINVADFCDENKLGKGKDLVETLSNLIGVFQDSGLDFGKNRAADDDLMGDAYEYLMKNFATESGKSKGQFYTPAEVSRVMAQVLGLHEATSIQTTIYDPTCGSGSLLLRAMSETPNGATIYGQEKDNATAGLAKMNMILHGVVDADIKQGDTINNPQHLNNKLVNTLQTFDFVVANPPFSTKSWLKTAKEDDDYKRWSTATGVPPAKNGDYAFLLHIIKSLNAKGHGACILPHGVLFRGNAETIIREDILVNKKCIKGIIGLPPNLFFGTGIPACIIILDKEDAANRKGIFMIDAKDGFTKDGAKNRLREGDIRRIVDTWNAHKDVPHYARYVSMEEIEQNGYNLNIPRYIDAVDTEIKQDIEAHLHGGLPEHDIDQMEDYWNACPTLKESLFKNSSKSGYCELIPKAEDIRKTVESNKGFAAQAEAFSGSFVKWSDKHRAGLMNLTTGIKPKELIRELSISLLEIFNADKSLVDAYDAYNQLMIYWSEVMQDDFYMIATDGWKVETYVPQPAQKKDKDGNVKKVKVKLAATVADLICDLLPVPIVVEAYFAKEQSAVSAAEDTLSEAESALEELLENNPEYLSDDNFDNKFNDASVKKKIKVLTVADAEEKGVLEAYLKLKETASKAKKDLKEANAKLLDCVVKKYPALTEAEIKSLVVEKKWFASIRTRLDEEMQRIIQTLLARVTDLNLRYCETLPEINESVTALEEKVNAHLQEMGFNL